MGGVHSCDYAHALIKSSLPPHVICDAGPSPLIILPKQGGRGGGGGGGEGWEQSHRVYPQFALLE